MYGRSEWGARGQACLRLGGGRVIAAAGAGRIAGFAGAVFEVIAHGVSPKMPSIEILVSMERADFAQGLVRLYLARRSVK